MLLLAFMPVHGHPVLLSMVLEARRHLAAMMCVRYVSSDVHGCLCDQHRRPSRLLVLWQAGAAILLTSSDHSYSHAEMATITAVTAHSNATSTVSLGRPLNHSHDGSLRSHAGQALDMRARVALLSRSIVVTSKDAGAPPYVATAGSTQAAEVAMSGVQVQGQVHP